MRNKVALAMACLLVAVAARAEILLGRVIGVTDGDTIVVLDAERLPRKVRLAGIDAPEKVQAFGNQSKKNLSSLVYGKAVEVEYRKLDRYSRIIGKVLVEGKDANLEQLKAGMAWWYRAYAKEQRPEDRAQYEYAEELARQRRVGFWQVKNPIPPWKWRSNRRQANTVRHGCRCGNKGRLRVVVMAETRPLRTLA